MAARTVHRTQAVGAICVLPNGQRLWFANFANREERITNGLQAFDTAADAGCHNVEQALRSYDVLPQVFFADPVKYFTDFKSAFLAAT